LEVEDAVEARWKTVQGGGRQQRTLCVGC